MTTRFVRPSAVTDSVGSTGGNPRSGTREIPAAGLCGCDSAGATSGNPCAQPTSLDD